MKHATSLRALAVLGGVFLLGAAAWAWDAHPWLYEAVGLREPPSSIWTSCAGDWRGNLVHGSGHVSFDQPDRRVRWWRRIFPYPRHPNDDLFMSPNGTEWTWTEATR